MMEFGKGWTLAQTLGKGSYGEVKLLLNRWSGQAVAMKVIDLDRHRDAIDSAREEVSILRMLSSPHVVRYYSDRREGTKAYIYLEYVSGGTLFNRIKRGIGMASWEGQKYFNQLMAGVEYLHCLGIAHHDLKPENILLDEQDNLKIADFGLATVFRFKGKEKLLNGHYGTLPYIAPEVLVGPYHGEPVDLWSCGIILVLLLSGELPWDQAAERCKKYVAWRDKNAMPLSVCLKVDHLAQQLIKKILVPLPSRRLNLRQIKVHPWCQKQFSRLGWQIG